ncbi:hypothetical protein HYZ97_04910 [Candidatus Pacearchaeota archaeon]|nr:hypothetical protein [Candidatus Pacearchaeota archaeon]
MYNDSKSSFGENKHVLEEATQIIANRGYSHAKRIEKLNMLVQMHEDSLSREDKTYLSSLLDKSYAHIAADTRKRKRIKNRLSALHAITSLRTKITPNGYAIFEKRVCLSDKIVPLPVISAIPVGLPVPVLQTYIEDKDDEPGNLVRYPPFGRLFYGVIKVAATIAVGISTLWMSYNNQSLSARLEETRDRALTQEISAFRFKSNYEDISQRAQLLEKKILEDDEQIRALQNDLMIAGRPDAEVQSAMNQTFIATLDKLEDSYKTEIDLMDKLRLDASLSNRISQLELEMNNVVLERKNSPFQNFLLSKGAE